MGDKTIIAWTDHTFNAWWGCAKVSEGCRHCYAAAFAARTGAPELWTSQTRRLLSDRHWQGPLTWNARALAEGRRHRVFCGSMMDWAEDHPALVDERRRLWDLIRRCPALDWQLLTKRPENVARLLPPDWGDGWRHVWLGVSIEDMRVAHRADILRGVPAALRFVSYEPALGPLDALDLTGFDWVIYGGESGAGYRPHDLAWPRAMRDRAAREGWAFFFKQSAAPRTEMGIELDGELVRHWPTSPAEMIH